MLKLKSLTTQLAGICLLAALFFNSCTSIQQTKEPVDSFSLFNTDADIYISVPVQTNTALLESVFYKTLTSDNTKNNDKSIQNFIKYSTRICLAYKTDDSLTFQKSENNTFLNFQNNSIEIILEGKFPVLTPFFVLTKKNGFTKKKFYSETGVKFTYWETKNNTFEVAFPNSNLILASSDSVGSIQKKILQTQNIDSNFNDTTPKSFSNDSYYNFLNNSNDITIYLTSPGKLIPQLFGISNIELAIDNAKINLKPDNLNNSYSITVILDMESQRSQSFFILFMGLAGNNQKYNITKIDDTKIKISDIEISVKQIEEFLE